MTQAANASRMMWMRREITVLLWPFLGYLQALGNEVLPGLYENLPPYTKQPPLQSTKVSPVAHSPAELAPEQPMHICVPVLLTVLQSQQPPTLQTRDSTGSCSIGDVSE